RSKNVTPTTVRIKLKTTVKPSMVKKWIRPVKFKKVSDQAFNNSEGNNCRRIYSETMTMAILTKLLAIRIVARSVRGFSFRCKIRSAALFLSCLSLSKSLVVSEKNATSEPEINAEQSSKMITSAMAKKISTEGTNSSGKTREFIL